MISRKILCTLATSNFSKIRHIVTLKLVVKRTPVVIICTSRPAKNEKTYQFSPWTVVAIGVNPSGVRVNATPATYAGAAARAIPPAKSPGIAAPAGICPRPAVKPCGNAAAPPPKAATRAPAESSAPLNPPSWKNRQNDILEKSF